MTESPMPAIVRMALIALILCIGCLVGLSAGLTAHAQDPIDWQRSAMGLSVEQNEERKTAGLGFVVQAENWPSLLLRGGVEDTGYQAIAGPIGIELGQAKLAGAGPATLSTETVDWSHNEMTFTTEDSSQLKMWVSRLSPALLLRGSGASAGALRLGAGNLPRNTFDGSVVRPGPEGPAFPKYVAYHDGGEIRIETLGASAIPLSMDQNWLLLWYGDNSHFVDTKAPLTYTDYWWEHASLPHGEAYQADAPLLLVFENQPTAIEHPEEGGIELSFANGSGTMSLLPLMGRDHPDAAETEIWSQGLPGEILQKAQWWAERLCSYPSSVAETYAYDAERDTTAITESFTFVELCAGGTSLAPIAPMLAIASDDLDVVFSGSEGVVPVVDADLNTEFGPTWGIENTSQYTWSVSGLGKYADTRRRIVNAGHPPKELESDLVSQAQGIIDGGHFAPWIFADHLPTQDIVGDIYWLNPGDSLYHLVEIAEALPERTVSGPAFSVREGLIDYIRAERAAYPPEDVYNLSLEEGTVRQGFSLDPNAVFYGRTVADRWRTYRKDVFLEAVPLYNFYALSRYYDLTAETATAQLWQKAEQTLDQTMREQDWATFYWFREPKIEDDIIWPGLFGERKRREDVVEANRHFAGLVGYIRQAKMAGDADAEELGRALLSKAAVLRAGMATYPRYLYAADLVRLPRGPAWQPEQTAGRWRGYLFNYDWVAAPDDARQVAIVDQFGVYLSDHADDVFPVAPYLTAYRDLVPELARFLGDHVREDGAIYAKQAEMLFPHWYAAFAEAGLGQEHGLSHPVNSFQLFVFKALAGEETPRDLAAYLDIPWLQQGDLFYAHKLAEAVKAYRGTTWDLVLKARPADRSIYLTWNVFDTLPPDVTWRIDYEGPTGSEPSPITGIPGASRAYALKGLTNYAWYTVTLMAMAGNAPVLSSNPVVVMPVGKFVYLPLVTKAF